MAVVAAAPPPLGTNKVGYSVDGKYVVLKCSMRATDICIAPSKRAYNKKKYGKLLWQAELGCYYCSRCLAHAEDHATRIADASRRAMIGAVSYTHIRAPETVLDIVCRLPLEKK